LVEAFDGVFDAEYLVVGLLTPVVAGAGAEEVEVLPAAAALGALDDEAPVDAVGVRNELVTTDR